MSSDESYNNDGGHPSWGLPKNAELKHVHPGPAGIDPIVIDDSFRSAKLLPERCDELLERLRGYGLMVAIHNDYWQDGKYYTFYLMTTRGGHYFKGESSMEHGGDTSALNQIKHAYNAHVTEVEKKEERR